jgi:hypothetical protein
MVFIFVVLVSSGQPMIIEYKPNSLKSLCLSYFCNKFAIVVMLRVRLARKAASLATSKTKSTHLSISCSHTLKGFHMNFVTNQRVPTKHVTGSGSLSRLANQVQPRCMSQRCKLYQGPIVRNFYDCPVPKNRFPKRARSHRLLADYIYMFNAYTNVTCQNICTPLYSKCACIPFIFAFLTIMCVF